MHPAKIKLVVGLIILVVINVVLSLYLVSKHEQKITTITGEAKMTKDGLSVQNIVLIKLSPVDIEKYNGKKIEVSGEVLTNHGWKCYENMLEEFRKKCFDHPVIQTIKTIRIVE